VRGCIVCRLVAVVSCVASYASCTINIMFARCTHLCKLRFPRRAVSVVSLCCALAIWCTPASARASVPAASPPWLVALVRSDGSAFCSASLLAPRVALTAAHCVSEGRFYVQADLNGTLHRVSRTVPHPKFRVRAAAGPRHTHVVHDLAVLHLVEPIRRTAYLTLPSPASTSPSGTLYGLSSQRANVALEVRTLTARADEWFDHVDPSRQIVAASPTGTASCPGDSGGALVATAKTRLVLVGVVSYGALRCGDLVPSVFTKVGAYLELICTQTPQSCRQRPPFP